MKSRTRLVVGLATLGLSANGIVASGTAMAADAGAIGPASLSQCNNFKGYTCFWARYDYTPERHVKHIPAVASGDCKVVEVDPRYLGSRSFWNRTSKVQRVWSTAHCTGENYLVYPDQRVPRSVINVNSVGGE